ncbi:MAG TPA: deoxyhypusine synthase [Nitrosopumilaceae archaeon]|nr:deoxyhypusine synthase [Nitrosopumilaceae archaeon]
MDHHHFKGKDIPHVKLHPKMTIEELVETFSRTGFNGRQLGNAAKLYAKMIKENATICLTVSGALTPVGFGGIFKTLIERGFVDWIITTGANVYHEDHFAWGLPLKQGHFEVDDMVLYEKEIVRIRDVFIKFYETLEAEDQIIQKMFKNNLTDKPFTSAEFCNVIGKISKEHSKFPEKSFVAAAYDYDVPVYVSTLKDSSLALNLAVHRLRDKNYHLDFVREIIEQGAILYNSKKSGIIELGGGVPKNTAQQTGPLLDQILRRDDGGQDYIIQITDARPDTGGLSGATLQEGKSWGKVQDAHNDVVTVYADATIAFPILALYVLSNQKPRKPKRLYKKLGKYYEILKKDYMKNNDQYYDLLDDDFSPKRKLKESKRKAKKS